MKVKNRLAFILFPVSLLLAAAQGIGIYILLKDSAGQELLANGIADLALGLAVSSFLSICIVLFVVWVGLERMVSRKVASLQSNISKMGEGKFADLDLDGMDGKGSDEMAVLQNALVSMRKSLEINHKSMQKLAFYDRLTGLPNRATLQQELKMLISDAKRKKSKFAVIYMDLDEFKSINDTLGHDVGDQLLKAVSERIRKLLRGSDFVARERKETGKTESGMLARLAGDEFTLLVHDVTNQSSVIHVANRILASISKPFDLEQHEIQVGASLGIALFPDDGEDPDSLIKKADYAMFEAKKHNKNGFEFYTKEMNAVAFQRMAMEKKIRKALDSQEFFLLFHPRIKLANKTIAGFEALIRWENPELGTVMPNQFIPLAEETLLICEIGYWVFDHVCQYIKHWGENGYPDVRVSINISTLQIYRGDTYNMLKTLLAVYGIKGGQLEIEVNEAGLLKDEKAAITLLEKLKELGITIALDEFGTENTSIRILQDFPIDVLKIDRSLVTKGESDAASKQLLKSFVEIANNLNLETVASGIENVKQVNYARSIKCDYVQGYYYAEPLHGDDATEFMTTWEIRQARGEVPD